MNLTYLEYYPHYLGTITREIEIPAEWVIDLFEGLKANNRDPDEELTGEMIEDVQDALEEKLGDPLYAFGNIFYRDTYPNPTFNYKKVMGELNEKGYWAGEWEEGSHALALPGKRKDALNALARIEAELTEDNFEF